MERQWCNSCGTEVETQRKREKGRAGILKWSRFTYHANFILTIKHPQQHALKGQTVASSFFFFPFQPIKIHYTNANYTCPHSFSTEEEYICFIIYFILLYYTIPQTSLTIHSDWLINYRFTLKAALIHFPSFNDN